MHITQGMYSNVRDRVWSIGQYNEGFGMAVGVHQGFILSQLLFILVLEAFLHKSCTGVPWKLLHADDLVLIVVTPESCIFKVKKTKILVSVILFLHVLKKSGKYSYVTCHSATTSLSACGTNSGPTTAALPPQVPWRPSNIMFAPGVAARLIGSTSDH